MCQVHAKNFTFTKAKWQKGIKGMTVSTHELILFNSSIFLVLGEFFGFLTIQHWNSWICRKNCKEPWTFCVKRRWNWKLKTYAYRMLKQCSCLLEWSKLLLSARGSAFDSYVILFEVSDLIEPVFTSTWQNSKPLVSQSVWEEYVYKPSQRVIYRITRHNTKISYKPMLLNIPLKVLFFPYLSLPCCFFFLFSFPLFSPSFHSFHFCLYFEIRSYYMTQVGLELCISGCLGTYDLFPLKFTYSQLHRILITVICCLNS